MAKALFQFFNNLKIRSKLLGGYTLAVLAAVLTGGTIIVVQVEKTIETRIESELTNTTATLVNMVKTSAATSIKNHLRAVAEKNQEIVRAVYRDFQDGQLTLDQAKALCRKILFSQTIGRTGYIFCADSRGVAIEHPNPGVAGRRFSQRAFVREMIRLKTGYLEYDWKNPEDDTLKPKAMYMTYFEPWDWIIAVSSYREEFRELVNVLDFEQSVLGVTFGKSGYAYINDSRGNLIVHPFMTGNYYDALDRAGRYFVRRICDMKTGKVVYSWKNPGEAEAREKLVIFDYLPEYDWIIASATYLDEVHAPLKTVKTVIIAIVMLICLLVFGLSFWINTTVVRPLKALMTRFDQGASGNFNVRMPVRSTDEIGQLAGYFNRFMDRLSAYSQKLTNEIAQKKASETALRLSEEMFSKAFRSSPAGMFIASLEHGRILNVNDSFLTITGFSLLDLIGRELLTLSFFRSREEGRKLFRDIKNRHKVKNREIWFLTAGREQRQGLVSGEGVDLWGEPCVLGALEDITEARRLEQEILNISQKERQKIAMALHDDLCPQLIGIEVMTKMLRQRLDQAGAGHAGLSESGNAERIRGLILDAIEKTRTLSKGLMPVDLSDRGFDRSLSELAAYVSQVFHISCTFDPGGATGQLFSDNDRATHAYYIAHEAVHNAVKHARATWIAIQLSQEGRLLCLTVTDNGQGMDPGLNTSGMGIRIMSYRAGRIGAELTVAPALPARGPGRGSDCGRGTRVALTLPVTPQDKEI